MKLGDFMNKSNLAEVIHNGMEVPIIKIPKRISHTIPSEHIPLISTNFKHIFKILDNLWGSNKFDEYVFNLFSDKTRIDRHGFSYQEIQELINISKIHSEKFFKAPDKNIWEVVGNNRG